MTSAPPKPKNLFTDVDDVDFEPEGLTEAAQNEKSRDWDSETDEREEQGNPQCGSTFQDLDMSKHDPRNPCVVHYKVPCVLADETVMPPEAKFRQLATALTYTGPIFSIACHGSEQIEGCDPIRRIMDDWAADLKKSFDSWDKSVQSDIWHIQNFSKWLTLHTDLQTFPEFWELLGKADWRAISEHTLRQMSYDPLKESLGVDAEEYMLEKADRDNSGDVSFDELKHFIGAVAQMSNMPLQPIPACAKHDGFRKYEVDANTLMTWASLFHSKYDQRYFEWGGSRYHAPHKLR